jgi:peptidoglycan biosynthesis protein MviN/MurJ (putative lipid II flippase)
MSYESYPQQSTSQTDELISQLQGIRITLIVGLIVLMIALAPWWLLGMGILMDEAGMGGD